ncbi:MAG: bifunctional phosphoribosyl-AMP cyclohydrolase/phosphoribosyl-ATP diphosphatase HisIE [Acidobacteria bacterium]|nr:bifunctional phosphoribosyl-AMP cyclohydrolase/phosphoribosyl-ATP diphosphatase HisIE [Acidobacteriota bacterium]
MNAPDPSKLAFDDGLLPAVIRESASGEVLMLAWMSDESYRKSLESGETWFWSRSRQELWNKGATSGHRQKIVAIATDCDSDALLIDVETWGPACHTGERSCFGDRQRNERLDLERLESAMKNRREERPEGSYTALLFSKGTDAILRKVGEETVELVLAVKGEGRQRIVEEATDLLVHVTALLVNEGIDLQEIAREMRRRER